MVKVLIGNKSDLGDRRAVREDEGRTLAQNNKIEFFETSAKDGKNVSDTFERLVSITLAGAPSKTEVEPPAHGSFAISAHDSEGKQPQPQKTGSKFKCCS